MHHRDIRDSPSTMAQHARFRILKIGGSRRIQRTARRIERTTVLCHVLLWIDASCIDTIMAGNTCGHDRRNYQARARGLSGYQGSGGGRSGEAGAVIGPYCDVRRHIGARSDDASGRCAVEPIRQGCGRRGRAEIKGPRQMAGRAIFQDSRIRDVREHSGRLRTRVEGHRAFGGRMDRMNPVVDINGPSARVGVQPVGTVADRTSIRVIILAAVEGIVSLGLTYPSEQTKLPMAGIAIGGGNDLATCSITGSDHLHGWRREKET